MTNEIDIKMHSDLKKLMIFFNEYFSVRLCLVKIVMLHVKRKEKKKKNVLKTKREY